MGVLGAGLVAALVLLLAGCAGGERGSDSEIPTLVEFHCSEAGASVSHPVVRPLADGVHVRASGDPPGELRVSWRRVADGVGWLGPVLSSEPAASVEQFSPDAHVVRCSTADGREVGASTTFEVRDPENLWRGDVGWHAEVVGDMCATYGGYQSDGQLRRAPGTPEEALRALPEARVADGDVLEPAGYPQAPDSFPAFNVLRDGRLHATVGLVPGVGGWALSWIMTCDASADQPLAR